MGTKTQRRLLHTRSSRNYRQHRHGYITVPRRTAGKWRNMLARLYTKAATLVLDNATETTSKCQHEKETKAKPESRYMGDVTSIAHTAQISWQPMTTLRYPAYTTDHVMFYKFTDDACAKPKAVAYSPSSRGRATTTGLPDDDSDRTTSHILKRCIGHIVK